MTDQFKFAATLPSYTSPLSTVILLQNTNWLNYCPVYLSILCIICVFNMRPCPLNFQEVFIA